MRLTWKEDEWGRSAVAGGWLTLAVSRAGDEWFAVVAGKTLTAAPAGQSERTRTFSNGDDAAAAAEKAALTMLDAARADLTG